MSHHRLTPFPVLNLELPDIPPRSRLYSLEPIGLGTAEVESLTSYLTRLAHAHRVSVNQLARREFTLRLNQNEEHPFDSHFTQRPLNGNAPSTGVTIAVLQTLTLRHDLRFLTMYPWREALARSKLLRYHLAWCPACYHAWCQSGQVIYHPLLWALEVVQLCPHHQQALQHHCPHPACQKRLPLVNNQGQLGYCPFCHRWLGSGSEVTPENGWTESEWAWQMWVTDCLSEMLTTVQHSPLEFQRHRVMQTIRSWLRVAASKSVHQLAAEMGMPAGRLFGWLTDDYLPELGLLARVCYHLDLTLLDILTTPPDLQIVFGQSQGHHPLGNPPHLGQPKIEVKTLCHQLEQFLHNPPAPPGPAYQVARQLGVSHTTLRCLCPELYQQLVTQYQQYQQTQRHLRTEKVRTDLKTFFDSDEIPPPSLSEVARRLQIPRATAQWLCPELCSLISEKYKTYQRSQKLESSSNFTERLTLSEIPSAALVEHDPFPELNPDRLNRPQPDETGKRAALKTALQTILTDPQNPPLALVQVARQLGYQNTETLRQLFPDLCHQIHQRYLTSRQQRARSTLAAVLADNPEPPPTLKEISQQVGYSANGLKRLWPDLCQALLEKRQHYQNSQTRAHEQALKAVLADEQTPPLSLKQLAAQLGCAPHTVGKYFPDLAAAVSEKYKTYRRQKALQRQQQLAEQVKQMTRQLHGQGIEPTLKQITLRLPYPKLIFMPYIRAAWREARRELGLPT